MVGVFRYQPAVLAVAPTMVAVMVGTVWSTLTVVVVPAVLPALSVTVPMMVRAAPSVVTGVSAGQSVTPEPVSVQV